MCNHAKSRMLSIAISGFAFVGQCSGVCVSEMARSTVRYGTVRNGTKSQFINCQVSGAWCSQMQMRWVQYATSRIANHSLALLTTSHRGDRRAI
uniref:Putative secreted protein n=1 Tax=Anopheles darlingi TaxID=43151 RepID=A0A2M4DAF4_ANODA